MKHLNRANYTVIEIELFVSGCSTMQFQWPFVATVETGEGRPTANVF